MPIAPPPAGIVLIPNVYDPTATEAKPIDYVSPAQAEIIKSLPSVDSTYNTNVKLIAASAGVPIVQNAEIVPAPGVPALLPPPPPSVQAAFLAQTGGDMSLIGGLSTPPPALVTGPVMVSSPTPVLAPAPVPVVASVVSAPALVTSAVSFATPPATVSPAAPEVRRIEPSISVTQSGSSITPPAVGNGKISLGLKIAGGLLLLGLLLRR